jgi:hypothetical protein
MPRVPIFPIKTLNVSFAGKLDVLIVTFWSFTTLTIEKVGILTEAEARVAAGHTPRGINRIMARAINTMCFIASSSR